MAMVRLLLMVLEHLDMDQILLEDRRQNIPIGLASFLSIFFSW